MVTNNTTSFSRAVNDFQLGNLINQVSGVQEYDNGFVTQFGDQTITVGTNVIASGGKRYATQSSNSPSETDQFLNFASRVIAHGQKETSGSLESYSTSNSRLIDNGSQSVLITKFEGGFGIAIRDNTFGLRTAEIEAVKPAPAPRREFDNALAFAPM